MIAFMSTPTSCQIVVKIKYSCCGNPQVDFRAYFGHYQGKEVCCAIRHLTEKEVRRGVSWPVSRYWLPIELRDTRLNVTYPVLLNIASIRKRFVAAGCFKEIIEFCIQSKNFSVLKLTFQDKISLPYITHGAFISHGPFI